MARNTQPVKWTKITKADLATFDDIATKVVLYAMEHGGVGRLSRKGHLILRAPDGGRTMSVPRDGNRSQQLLESMVRKLFPEDTPQEAPPRRKTTDELIAEIQASIPDHPELECPAKGCEAVFVTEGARYSHIEKNHAKCLVAGCGYVARNAKALGGHHTTNHTEHKPWDAAGRASHERSVARKLRGGSRIRQSSLATRLLIVIHDAQGEPVTLDELAERSGLDRDGIAVRVANSLRNAQKDTGEGSPWRNVRRVGHGVYAWRPGDGQETRADLPEGEPTQEKVEPLRQQPTVGDALPETPKTDAVIGVLNEVIGWFRGDRQMMLDRIKELEAELDDLRDRIRRTLEG